MNKEMQHSNIKLETKNLKIGSKNQEHNYNS